MVKDRSRWEIILDLLVATKEDGKVRKTRIMQKSCLDWRNFRRYFDFLLEEGFISASNPEGYFMITKNGEELLRRLKDVKEMLD